jgi:hypothetical protein
LRDPLIALDNSGLPGKDFGQQHVMHLFIVIEAAIG